MNLPSAHRRGSALLVGAIVALPLAFGAAAGASSDPDGASGTAAPTASVAAFPVTIDTAYGEITVEEKPERIVALSGRHLELLTLLDEPPVAFADYDADDEQLRESYPWMAGTYEGEPDPGLFTAEYQPSPEAIAALEPDLIVTTIWQTDEQLYEQLSQVAPTYVGTDPSSNTDWRDDLASLAALTGHDGGIVAETEAELDAAFAAAAERLPGLRGATFYIAALGDGNELWLTEYGTTPVLGLGLEPGDGQPLTGEEGADAPRFSQENIDQITADVVFVSTNRDPSGEFRDALEADPRLAELPASANGTLIFLTEPQWLAVNGGSAASEMWWLDQIVPVLEDSALNQSGE